MTKLGVFQVAKRFKTPVKGVTGYLLNQHGRYSVVYGIDGYVLAGALISPTGANLTATYNHQYAPKPAYAGIIKALEKDGALIAMGSPAAKHVLYIFEDPNCIFCHKLSVALAPYIKSGKVRIKIAPVAFVHPDSMGKSTAILAAKDPGAAWATDETEFDTRTEEGGYPAQNPPDPKLVAAVRRNMQLMGKAGFGGTPGIMYRGTDGKWAGAAGFPGNAWLVRQFGNP
jgi:thiol:disulfide interchange protein DsbG